LAGASQHQGQVFLYNNNHNMDKATDEYDDDNDNDNAVILSPLSKYSNHQIAWLQQQDNFFEMLTVKETLELAAFLELPGVSYLQRNEMISSLMDGLGLHYEFGNETCRPTHILSGGERRRLSVALELLSSEEVKVLLADEVCTVYILRYYSSNISPEPMHLSFSLYHPHLFHSPLLVWTLVDQKRS
jgi:ABC-type multidrug transport system ATPase subunit